MPAPARSRFAGRGSRTALAHALAAGAVAALVLLAPPGPPVPPEEEPGAAAVEQAEIAEEERPSWSDAAALVTEDRGEPTGRGAVLTIPRELLHYADRKRFLAVQVASWREHDLPRPEDDLELVALVARGVLVPAPVVGPDHVLYGIGGKVTGEPFRAAVKGLGEVPLLAGPEQVAERRLELASRRAEAVGRAAALRAESAKVPLKQRTRRRQLQHAAAKATADAAAVAKEARLLQAYEPPEQAAALFARHAEIAAVAERLGPKPYDLADPAGRRAFRGRLMTVVRPEALAEMLDLARAYSAEFRRPLPISSLIRTEEYQRRLSRTNANATRIDVPPHTTGLAFDVLDAHMTAAEQRLLLDEIARREREGRLEALRENNGHVHVFVFPAGQPPPGDQVAREAARLRAVDVGARLASARARTAKTAKRRSAGRR